MRDVGGDDGGEAGEESWVELMVFAEQDGGGDDAVNRLEVVRQIGGVGAQMAQQTDVKSIGEKRANPGEEQQPEPIKTVEIEQPAEGTGPVKPPQAGQTDHADAEHFPYHHDQRVEPPMMDQAPVEYRENRRHQGA